MLTRVSCGLHAAEIIDALQTIVMTIASLKLNVSSNVALVWPNYDAQRDGDVDYHAWHSDCDSLHCLLLYLRC